jgi:hypothetical protein
LAFDEWAGTPWLDHAGSQLARLGTTLRQQFGFDDYLARRS